MACKHQEASDHVRSPKVYFPDSGILHHYLDVVTRRHWPRPREASKDWGLVGVFRDRVRRTSNGAEDRECYFWATHRRAEIDFVVQRGSELRKIRNETVGRSFPHPLTKPMQTALVDLGLSRIDVIQVGEHRFRMARLIHAVLASRMFQEI